MKYKNQVSIVIPTYNEEKDIANTLDNLLIHKEYIKEILIIDDSNDKTPEIVQKISEKNELIKYFIEKQNLRNKSPGVLINCETKQ